MEKEKEKNKQKTIRQEITKVSGETGFKEYLKVKLLGKGGFANCYLTKNLQTDTLSATKIVSKSILLNPRTKIKLQNQIKIHKKLHCEYIVKFDTAFEDTENVYVMMELCPNNNLNDYLADKRKISVPESQKIIYELAEGLKYLHSKKIIHRDIKLGNIFLGEKNKVKIGDFGLAAKIEFEGEKKRTVCGTPNYLAPEIIKGVGYSYEVDIWSIGIMLYTLLVGIPPFETQNLQETYQKILNNNYGYNGTSVPNQAKDLIKNILNVNPALRPTIQNIIESDFMKFGKLNVLIQPTLKSKNYIKHFDDNKENKRWQSTAMVAACMQIKQGFSYILSNGTRGLVSENSSLIISENKNCITLIHKDKIDKVKNIAISQLNQQQKASKILLQSIKFEQSKHQIKKQSDQQQFIYVKKYVLTKNSFCILRMSNQTVHFKWDDGGYGIANKSMRFWITDGRKEKIEIGINQQKQMNKGMKMKVGLIKQFLNKT